MYHGVNGQLRSFATVAMSTAFLKLLVSEDSDS